jgi:hypothetical protein
MKPMVGVRAIIHYHFVMKGDGLMSKVLATIQNKKEA